MGITTDNLLIFFNNNLSSPYILKDLYDHFNNIYSFFKNIKSLNDYDKYIRSFPMYNIQYFKPITSLKLKNNQYFSTLKIKSSVIADNNILLQNISKDVLTIKNETDKYLNNIDLINFTTSLQNVILNNEHVNRNMLRLDSTRLNTDNDRLFSIVNNKNKPAYDDSSTSNLIEFSVLYYLTLNIFVTNNSSFYINLSNLIQTENEINNDSITGEFNTYINGLLNEESEEFILNLSNFICQKNFNIFEPSNNFLSQFKHIVKSEILSSLPTLFETYLSNIDFQKRLISVYLKYLRNTIAFSIYKKQISDFNIFDYFIDFYSSVRSTELDNYFSDDYLDSLINQYVTVNNLKKYLTPMYLYTDQVYKFLNSISRFIQLYVDEKLIHKVKYCQYSRLRVNTDNLINNILNNFDSTKLFNYYNTLNYNQIIEDNQVSKLTSFLITNDILKDFFNSDIFTNFLIDKLSNINKYLYNNKWVVHDYNWYEDIELLRHYLLSYFNLNLCYKTNGEFENRVFPNFSNALNNNIQSIVTSEYLFNYDEISELDQNISQLKSSQLLKDNIYTTNIQILDATIKKQVYFKVLSSFVE